MASEPQEKQETLEIAQDTHANGVLVQLRGAATMDHVSELEEQLDTLTSSGVPIIVMDLSNLRFINSLGLGILVMAHVRCMRRGQSLRLVSPSPSIADVFSVTKLTGLFRVYASVDEAFNAA